MLSGSQERAHAFLSGIILAAGASARMGRPKQLLLLDGKPLLQHVVDEAAASCLDEVIVVLGHAAEEIQRALRLPSSGQVRIILNPDHAAGQSTSLRAGLRAASPRAEGVAILLGDQPGVRAELIDRIAAAFRAGSAPMVRPVHRRSDGVSIPGHPVFLARRVWPEIEQLRGDEGARAVLRAHPELLTEVPIGEEPATDVDTREDYARAIDAARARRIRE